MKRSCFIRFNEPNPCGRSKNYRDGTWEAGNSVYYAREEHGEYIIACLQPNTLISLVSNHLLTGCPIFEVEGDELLDRGSDGEVLLGRIKIVRKLYIVRGSITSRHETLNVLTRGIHINDVTDEVLLLNN